MHLTLTGAVTRYREILILLKQDGHVERKQPHRVRTLGHS